MKDYKHYCSRSQLCPHGPQLSRHGDLCGLSESTVRLLKKGGIEVEWSFCESALCALAHSPWELDEKKFLSCFDAYALTMDAFLEELDELAADFADSRPWEYVYHLLYNDLMTAPRDARMIYVCRQSVWKSSHIVAVRKILKIEAKNRSAQSLSTRPNLPEPEDNPDFQDVNLDDAGRGDLNSAGADNIDEAIMADVNHNNRHGETPSNAGRSPQPSDSPDDQRITKIPSTKRKRKQTSRKKYGEPRAASKKARFNPTLESVDEEPSFRKSTLR